jgi:hypothetical protein
VGVVRAHPLQCRLFLVTVLLDSGVSAAVVTLTSPAVYTDADDRSEDHEREDYKPHSEPKQESIQQRIVILGCHLGD